MDISVAPHTLERAEERGTTLEEIKDVLATGHTIPVKYGRAGKAKVYDFKKDRNGVYYEQKRVEVVYTIVNGVAVTVTVYVFYGKWEARNADSV